MTHVRYSNISNQSRVQKHEPRRRRPYKRVLFLTTILIVGFMAYKVDVQVKAADHASALATQAHRQQQQKALAKTVNNVINSNPQITFSVSMVDLGTNSEKNFGVGDSMEAASTSKLITAAAFLHDVQTGSENLDEQIGGYSARSELNQMINQSDDTAWANLNTEIGNDQLQSYAQDLGLSSYDVYTNQVSSSDIAKLLAKLYSGDLLNQANTKLLLGFMQHTNYEDFIPPAVPAGDQVYHKVGELNDYVHDAAIITNGHQSFVLAIFTNGNGIYDWPERANMMQQITKAAVSAYFN